MNHLFTVSAVLFEIQTTEAILCSCIGLEPLQVIQLSASKQPQTSKDARSHRFSISPLSTKKFARSNPPGTCQCCHTAVMDLHLDRTPVLQPKPLFMRDWKMTISPRGGAYQLHSWVLFDQAIQRADSAKWTGCRMYLSWMLMDPQLPIFLLLRTNYR